MWREAKILCVGRVSQVLGRIFALEVELFIVVADLLLLTAFLVAWGQVFPCFLCSLPARASFFLLGVF
jgi:hypothetical protein